MKNYLLYSALLCSGIMSAQVGIGTSNPQQIFHVDSGKNSPATTTDDFVVTTTGNVGIGTINPTVKLEINNGTTNGAIKIVDGTEGVGKVLMTDANGVGKWGMPNSFKSIIVGSGSGSPTSDDSGVATKFSGFTLTGLTTGKWLVNVGLTIKTNVVAPTNYWLEMYLSDTQGSVTNSSFTIQGPNGNSSKFGGIMFGGGTGGGTNNFISGSMVINVTASTTPVYLLIQNISGNTPQQKWAYSMGNWENYFYAVPIN